MDDELSRLEEHAEIERRVRLFLEHCGANDGRIEDVVRRIVDLTIRQRRALGPMAVPLR